MARTRVFPLLQTPVPLEEPLKEDNHSKLTREFVQIASPALLQLAAEPLAGLVDTAYLGRLGPSVLGGAGVAVSAQYAVSKLYNDPLLRTSISLVASEDNSNDEKLSNAVSSALILAAAVGVVQMLVYSIFCVSITATMGVDPSSPMFDSAVSYLRIRALGTPAATLWLVTNGVFRGLGDTQTPLVYSLLFTGLNIVLDPIFIFVLKWGAAGAAAGTALAQYAALIPLLRSLPVAVRFEWSQLVESLKKYVRAGALVLVRTVGKVLAYTVCARQAALLGAVSASAYSLTFQLGFATTQICEAVAVAVQTLMARETASDTTEEVKRSRVRHLIRLSVRAGGVVATALSLLTYLTQSNVLAGLTTNVAVQGAAAAIFPVVLLTQVFKGLAYPVNGILMGGLDWFYSMIVMWVANVSCVGLIRWFGRTGALVSLEEIWWALAAFMGTQVVLGIVRYQSKTGVWKLLREKTTK